MRSGRVGFVGVHAVCKRESIGMNVRCGSG